MINFTYASPTRIIFGRETENQAGAEIRALGFDRVLVHYGSNSAKKSGLLDRVYASLAAAGIAHESLGGVQPNPRLKLVREGIALCKKHDLNFILAVGGGSVIDSAKAIAYGIANDFDVWDLFNQERGADACAPVGCILTIAAAGSESSNSCVITDGDDNRKRNYNNEIARPRFAILNPELTLSVPKYPTMAGVVDCMMHTMERYFTNDTHVELTDRLCEGLLVTTINNGKKLLDNLHDYDARAEILWAASLSHNGLTGTGRTGDFASHQLEHDLSGMFDVSHGAGLAVIWPSWARYVYKHNIPRFAQFAVNVMGCPMQFSDPEQTALAGIRAVEEFFQSLGMPVTMRDLGIDTVTNEQIETMVENCSWNGQRTIGQLVKLDRDDMRQIYQMAR